MGGRIRSWGRALETDGDAGRWSKRPVIGNSAAAVYAGRAVLRSAFFAATLAVLALTSGAARAQDQRFMVISTGGVTGVYHPVGSAICQSVNKTRSEHGLRCTAESEGGSIANLEALRSGRAGFAIVQADWLHHAYLGTSVFAAKGPHPELRTVLGLHSELATLVVRASSEAASLTDLKGARVNIGPDGSGSAATWQEITDMTGWSSADQAQVLRSELSGLGEALCAGDIDAYFVVIGHPAGVIEDTQAQCSIRLIGIEAGWLENMLEAAPYYRSAQIPAGVYDGLGPVETIGTGSYVVSVDAMPDAVVDTVLRAVFKDVDRFRLAHPALDSLVAPHMLQTDTTVPLHHGAYDLYREKGYLQ